MRSTRVALVCALAAFVACGEGEYVEPPPPVVTVAVPEQRAVTDYIDVTGNAESVERVKIRARVEGFLQSIEFEEGQDVEQGDLLYTIDPSEYEARVDQAKARLATAQASLTLAEATLKRRAKAFKSGAVSELEVLENRAQVDVAVARVQSAEAELRKANLDLGYTRIRAPFTGRVGHSDVDPGNLVGAGEKTLLTELVRFDPIYIYFTLSERQVIRLSEAAQTKVTGDEDRIRVIEGNPLELGRATDEGFPLLARLDFGDPQIDPATGTLRLRAVMENPAPIQLVPGMFLRGRLPVRQRQSALLVSERALGADQSGRYVLVVDENDVAQYRPVKLGALVDGMRVIEEGIEAGERVITTGLLFARPGAKVSPQLEGAEPGATAAAAGADSAGP